MVVTYIEFRRFNSNLGFPASTARCFKVRLRWLRAARSPKHGGALQPVHRQGRETGVSKYERHLIWTQNDRIPHVKTQSWAPPHLQKLPDGLWWQAKRKLRLCWTRALGAAAQHDVATDPLSSAGGTGAALPLRRRSVAFCPVEIMFWFRVTWHEPLETFRPARKQERPNVAFA